MADVTEIVPGLWMGGEAVLPLPPQGFDAICSLRDVSDWHTPAFPSDKNDGPCYLHVPMIDMNLAPPRWRVDLAVEFAAKSLLMQKKVLVHCQEGHNRSGIVVAAYLIKNCSYSAATAIAFIRLKRPGALSNNAFIKALLEY